MTSPPTPAGLRPATTVERVGARAWTAIVVVGLVGQIAWTVENMYLNVFVYERITQDPTVIATMVALSAIAATVATIFVGAWSDRTGRRRVFVAIGYVAWGASTAAFGLLAPPEGEVAAPYVMAAVVGIVALDCVMSIIGSGANNAAFGAWVTDVTTPRTRGRADAVLAVMPLIAMLLVFGALDGFTQAGDWRLFFGIVGALTTLSGLVAWALMRDAGAPALDAAPSPALALDAPPALDAAEEGGSLVSRLILGFRPSMVRANAPLYLSLAMLVVIGTSAQVFLPYVIIYLQHGLGVASYALILGVSLIAASGISLVGGVVMDRIGKRRVLLPATALFAVGLIIMFFARDTVPVIIAAALALGGMMLATASVSATARDETPDGQAGMVQGLRMVTGVMIPMVVGPFIGAWVIVGAGATYDDLGVQRPVPGPAMFLAAAAVLILVPALSLWRTRLERRAA